MRSFIIWLATTCAVFGGLASALNSYSGSNPCLVVVAIDTSFDMTKHWPKIPGILDEIDNGHYEVYELIGPRGRIHPRAQSLDLGTTKPYGPRDLSPIASVGGEACRKVFITNAPATELNGFADWTVIRP